ncbi:metalloprotease [Bonamia ostreae]
MSREIKAIQNEYLLNYQNDHRRVYNLQKSLINKNNPFSKFSTGNIETLSSLKSDDLLKFHSKHYIGKNISIASVSNMSLEKQRKLIESEFAILSKQQNFDKKLNFSNCQFDDLKNVFVRLKPVKFANKAIIIWPLKSFYKKWDCSERNIISHCLGHEGNGSILNLLKFENLAKSLTVTTSDFEFGSKIEMVINLTPNGQENYKSVFGIVLNYIDLLAKSEKSYFKNLNEELNLIQETKFNSRSKRSASLESINIATNIFRYGIENSIKGPFVKKKFKFKKLIKLLNFILVPENCFFILFDNDLNENNCEIEKWYKIKYKKSQISSSLEKLNLNINNKFSVSLNLPKQNLFLPEKKQNFTKKFENFEMVKFFENSSLKCWHKESNFGTSKCRIDFEINDFVTTKNIENYIKSKIRIKILNNRLKKNLYDALICGYFFKIKIIHSGHKLYCSGYTEKAILVISEFLNVLQSTKIQNFEFQNAIFSLKKKLKNSLIKRSNRFCNDKCDEILNERYWNFKAQLDCVDKLNLTKNDIELFSQNWNCSQKGCQLLITGKSDQNFKKSIIEKLKSLNLILNSEKWFKNQSTFIKPGNNFYEFDHPIEKNNCVRIVFELGDYDSLSESKAMVLSRLLKQPFFNHIRTQNCRSYLVHSGYFYKNSNFQKFRQIVFSSIGNVPFKHT